MIFLTIYGTGNEDDIIIGTVGYFFVSGIIALSCIAAHSRFSKTEFCSYYINKSSREDLGKSKMSELSQLEERVKDIEQDMFTSNAKDDVGTPNTASQALLPKVEEEVAQKRRITFSELMEALRASAPYPHLMFLLYIQTFWFFPGVMLMKDLSFVNFSWMLVWYVLAFNVADTLAKKAAAI